MRMTQHINNGCSSSGESNTQNNSSNEKKRQATPFNLTPFGVLLIFCIISSLTSSLYHNWPAVERILVDDRVMDSLCTPEQRERAVEGLYVCENQRKAIGNLALIVFYGEFGAFAVGGPLTDILGVFVVLILGFTCGFSCFMILYFGHSTVGIVKFAFLLWGFFGGFVFITSVHFPRMFPEFKSLADGMIIFFDNLSGAMPVLIHWIMTKYKIRYYEAFGTYILWGIIPTFILVIAFIPRNISGKGTSNIDEFKKFTDCLPKKLKQPKLWSSLVALAIPGTCAIFYRTKLSSYFSKDQTIIQIFPIMLFFVFLPTPLISLLNQFMGVETATAILSVLYIFAFLCLLYPTRFYGMVSIVLFAISSSSVEQQAMTYVSEEQELESTLMGVSYTVSLVVGLVFQFIFKWIHKVSKKTVVYFIIALFVALLVYFISYPHIDKKQEASKSDTKRSFKIFFIIFWFIPFLFLLIVLSLKQTSQHEDKDKSKLNLRKDIEATPDYYHQKENTLSLVFYSFSVYYVCNIFLVLATIFKVSRCQFFDDKMYWILLFAAFFVVPHGLVTLNLGFQNTHVNITYFMVLLFFFKVSLYFFSFVEFSKTLAIFFAFFLTLYGYTFFLFIYMLFYYNFKLSRVEPCKPRVMHLGIILQSFVLFRIFYNVLSSYKPGYYILWFFCCGYFLIFTTVLYFYFPYEMDLSFEFKACNLPALSLIIPFKKIYSKDKFYKNLPAIFLTVCNFALLVSVTRSYTLLLILIVLMFIHTGLMCFYFYFQEINDYTEFVYYGLYGLSGLSFLFFLTLYILKTISCDEYVRVTNVLTFLSLVCSGLLGNLTWFCVQKEFGKCCCKESDENCDCCNCCQDCKKVAARECCCTGQLISQCQGNNKCPCCCYYAPPVCKKECSCNGDKKYRCKCLQFADDKWVFCFYKTQCEDTDYVMFAFFMGNILGWAVFLSYICGNVQAIKIPNSWA